jgi:hypothetical protein
LAAAAELSFFRETQELKEFQQRGFSRHVMMFSFFERTRTDFFKKGREKVSGHSRPGVDGPPTPEG